MGGNISSFPKTLPADDDSNLDLEDGTSSVVRIMQETIPELEVTDEAKVLAEHCVVEFIQYVTTEANKQCEMEGRKMVTSEDLKSAMSRLGFHDLHTEFHNQFAAEDVVGVPPSPPHEDEEEGAVPNEGGNVKVNGPKGGNDEASNGGDNGGAA